MADQENCMRVTRLASRKRAAEVEMVADRSKKKRVVLGEIQNVLSSRDQKTRVVNEKQKIKPQKKAKILKVDPAIDLNGTSDDPQMCGAYASDIYEYLHHMEVSNSLIIRICWILVMLMYLVFVDEEALFMDFVSGFEELVFLVLKLL